MGRRGMQRSGRADNTTGFGKSNPEREVQMPTLMKISQDVTYYPKNEIKNRLRPQLEGGGIDSNESRNT